MNDFTKLKIALALALLGPILTLNSLIGPHVNKGFSLVNINIPILWPLLSFSILIGVTVYCYAFSLINEKFQIFKNAANFVYVIALAIPPLYLLLYIVSTISYYIDELINKPIYTNILEYSLIFLSGVIINLLISILFRQIKRKDKKEEIIQLSKIENEILHKVKSLFNDGYYDTVIIEAWKSIETSLKKILISENYTSDIKSITNMLQFAKDIGILNENYFKQLNVYRMLRNEIAHNNAVVSKNEAEKMISLTEKIIIEFNSIVETCYFCNNKFSKKDMLIDDHETYYVCKDCAKKKPDWKEYFLYMGMDS
jgi:uncharacterized protein (UPF0332 family)